MKIASEYLYYALQPEPDRKTILALMRILVEEIVKHFDSEEQILNRLQYPEVKEHKRVREVLLLKASRLQEEYIAEQISSFAFCSFFIDDVVISHMIHDDQKFFSYTRNQTK